MTRTACTTEDIYDSLETNYVFGLVNGLVRALLRVSVPYIKQAFFDDSASVYVSSKYLFVDRGRLQCESVRYNSGWGGHRRSHVFAWGLVGRTSNAWPSPNVLSCLG